MNYKIKLINPITKEESDIFIVNEHQLNSIKKDSTINKFVLYNIEVLEKTKEKLSYKSMKSFRKLNKLKLG